MPDKAHTRYAEYAAEHWLIEAFGCVVTRRATRTQFNKVDLFHADVLGKDREGFWYAVQATAGGRQAVHARKKKLERIPWHYSDTVFVVQLVTEQDPKHKRRKVYSLNVHEYSAHRGPSGLTWDARGTVPVPRHWLKPYRVDSLEGID